MTPVLGDECSVFLFSAISMLNDQNVMNHNATISNWNRNESANTNEILIETATDSIDSNTMATDCELATECVIDIHCDKHCDAGLEIVIWIETQSARENVFEFELVL